MKRLRVGVIYGGRSGEHEVSLASAAAVFAHLDRQRYEPVPIRIEKDGRWALAHSRNTYSVIGVDAYRLPYIPWNLTTREFFHLPDPSKFIFVDSSFATGNKTLKIRISKPTKTESAFPVLISMETTSRMLLLW